MQSSSKSLKYNSEGYKSESFGYNLFRLLNFRVKKLFIRHLEKRNKIQTRKKNWVSPVLSLRQYGVPKNNRAMPKSSKGKGV